MWCGLANRVVRCGVQRGGGMAWRACGLLDSNFQLFLKDQDLAQNEFDAAMNPWTLLKKCFIRSFRFFSFSGCHSFFLISQKKIGQNWPTFSAETIPPHDPLLEKKKRIMHFLSKLPSKFCCLWCISKKTSQRWPTFLTETMEPLPPLFWLFLHQAHFGQGPMVLPAQSLKRT